MESLLLDWDENVSELQSLIESLRNILVDVPVPKVMREGFQRFEQSVNEYTRSSESEDLDQISQASKMVAVYGQTIGQAIPSFKDADERVKEIGEKIYKKSNDFRDLVENSPLDYKPLTNSSYNSTQLDIKSFNSIKKNLNALSEDHEKHDQRIKKLLNENELRIETLGGVSKDLESKVRSEIDKVTLLYEDTLNELVQKKEQINDLLGHVSGRAIAGDFEKSATDEKVMADRLRYVSLACMGLIVAIIAYSFWESTRTSFNWESSIFRVVLSFILSVPAEYLARESAKHREQQYGHQQTSLDLKAITPYIASLPEEEQHKIKIEIAGRLFATRDFSRVGADPYPINTQEVVMEMLKKFDFKNPESKS